VDPFTDSSTLAHLAVINNSTLNISAGAKTVWRPGRQRGHQYRVRSDADDQRRAEPHVRGDDECKWSGESQHQRGQRGQREQPSGANLSLIVSGDGAKIVLGSDQDLKSLTITDGTGLQSVDLNSPAGAGESMSCGFTRPIWTAQKHRLPLP